LREFWRTIEQERCTVVLVFHDLQAADGGAAVETLNLSHVRWLISGGRAAPPLHHRAYQRRGVVFKQGYGLTESA